VSWEVDHLVVAARTLDEGVAWCEATLGLVPADGGRHPLMGTHNRVFAIGSARFPRAYFEIIAIDPQAAPPGRTRWFDLDEARLQHALTAGPALIHWVARCTTLDAELAALHALGIDRGEALAAERDTAAGRLSWRIAVRPDGRRLHGGALPTLIEWGGVHPADTLPANGVVLESLALGGLPPEVMAQLPPGVTQLAGGAAMLASLSTPRGKVSLQGLGEPR
jgi:hypothetical protein